MATISIAVSESVPSVAVIVVVPSATPVARPFVGTVSEIVAMVGIDDNHPTDAVMFCIEPSLNVPVATNCWVRAMPTIGVAGVTSIEIRTASVTTTRVLEK